MQPIIAAISMFFFSWKLYCKILLFICSFYLQHHVKYNYVSYRDKTNLFWHVLVPSKLVPIMMSSSNNHLDTTNIVAPHLWTAKSFLKDGPDTRATYATTSSLKRPHKPTNTSIRKGKKKKPSFSQLLIRSDMSKKTCCCLPRKLTRTSPTRWHWRPPHPNFHPDRSQHYMMRPD